VHIAHLGSDFMPGSFDTLHQLEADGRCRIVSAADKLQLVQRHPRIARREELDVAMAPHVVRMMEGRAPPLAALRGDGQDVSKLSALKKVAVALMERRSMLFHEATRLFIAAALWLLGPPQRGPGSRLWL